MDIFIVFMQNYLAPCTWLAIHDLGQCQQGARKEDFRVMKRDFADDLGKVSYSVFYVFFFWFKTFVKIFKPFVIL